MKFALYILNYLLNILSPFCDISLSFFKKSISFIHAKPAKGKQAHQKDAYTNESSYKISFPTNSPIKSPVRFKENASVFASESSDNTFRDIYAIKALNKAKFQIYLIKSRINKKYFAMKTFPFSKGAPHNFFRNEARFSFLKHENIVNIHYAEPERETNTQGLIQKMSYIIMEYAPYGDLFDFIMNYTMDINDKLVRTYFRQLIEGIEYLHQNGVSHLDLKPENLLIGENYTLKIADFDLSYLDGDTEIFSEGTVTYSAPELTKNECNNTQAADIYSAGIILFMLNTRGSLPYPERKYVGGVNFEYLLHNSNQEFWLRHCKVRQQDESFFEEDFKELFNSMVKLDPSKRATVQQIKQSRWYNGPCYTQEELKIHMGNLLSRK